MEQKKIKTHTLSTREKKVATASLKLAKALFTSGGYEGSGNPNYASAT